MLTSVSLFVYTVYYNKYCHCSRLCTWLSFKIIPLCNAVLPFLFYIIIILQSSIVSPESPVPEILFRILVSFFVIMKYMYLQCMCNNRNKLKSYWNHVSSSSMYVNVYTCISLTMLTMVPRCCQECSCPSCCTATTTAWWITRASRWTPCGHGNPPPCSTTTTTGAWQPRVDLNTCS